MQNKRKKLELYEVLQHTSSFLLLQAIRTHIIPFINWINSILNLFQLLCTYFGKLFKNLTAVNTGNLIVTNLQLSKARLVLSLLFPTDFPCCTKTVHCVSYSLFFFFHLWNVPSLLCVDAVSWFCIINKFY